MGFYAPALEIVILARTSVGTIPTKIKDLWLTGKMRMEIDLVPHFPHMRTMAVTFLGALLTDQRQRKAPPRARRRVGLCTHNTTPAHTTSTDTPVCDFDITPLGVNLMEVPYIASILQKMVGR